MRIGFWHLGLVLCVVNLGHAQSQPLKSVRFNGVSYVTVREVADYYGLGRDAARDAGRAEYRTSFAQLALEVEHRDIAINGVTHWISTPVLAARNQLWIAAADVLKTVDPVLRQGRGAVKTPLKTIVLDPGHGGTDRGTCGARSREKDLTLDLAKRLQRELTQSDFRVLLTRTTDENVSLPERVEFAERKQADLFVSLHFNSGGSAEGIETYCVTPAGQSSTAGASYRRINRSDEEACAGNKADERNVWLAHCVQRSLVQGTGSNDRGVRRARFVVIRDAPCPAVLVESGFLSNRTEEQRALNPDYRDKLAKAIADAIREYRKSTE